MNYFTCQGLCLSSISFGGCFTMSIFVTCCFAKNLHQLSVPSGIYYCFIYQYLYSICLSVFARLPFPMPLSLHPSPTPLVCSSPVPPPLAIPALRYSILGLVFQRLSFAAFARSPLSDIYIFHCSGTFLFHSRNARVVFLFFY